MVQAGINLATTRSLEGRLDLYQMTFKGWLEHPLIGWGTENDWNPAAEPTPTPSPQPTPTPPPGPSPTPVPLTSVPPLGSHSLYLGALYKQGVIGLALVLLLVFAVGRRAVRRYRRGDVGAELMLMAVLTSLLAGLTEDLWLDPATATVIAMSWAMAASFVPSVLPGRDPVEGRADP
jgi:O-antigen ligase